MEFKVFKNENSKILKEYWLTQSEWDTLDKTTVQEGDIYHIVGTIDKGDLSADVNASLSKGDSSLQKPTAALAKESFVKIGIDGTQKFDESSYVVAPSADGTAGQVLKKTATGTEWANESGGGKLYRHNLTCSDINNSQEVDISTYSTKQAKFTVDYIKANPTCLNGSISTVVDANGQESFDRRIFRISVDNIPPATDFVIESAGTTPVSRQLKLTSDDVIEV